VRSSFPMSTLGPADNVLLQMFRTTQVVRELMAHTVEGTGIRPDEYAVLSTIGYLKRVSPTELADRLRVPPTTISRYVAGLVESGLAVRTPNPDDGRSYLLELTDDGRAVIATVGPRFRATLHRLGEHAPLDEIEVALLELERAAREIAFDSTATRQ
jgi:DNA-binding MarR family transcriptional regulator